jgi:hypothetical protein
MRPALQTSNESDLKIISANEAPMVPARVSKPDSASSISRDNPNLDFVGAAAVLCVFGGHLHLYLAGKETELSWRFGQIGVLIFFDIPVWHE